MGITKIYNQDSRFLREITDNSVDVVITSPPFNICHKYMSYHDSLDYDDFDDMCSAVIKSISRVLKDDGVFLVDIADIIVMENQIIYGAEFIKEKACSAGLEFLSSFPYIAIEGSDTKMKSCISRDDGDKRFHSLCEQILVFGKSLTKRDLVDKLHIKYSYSYSNLKDSAFWPNELVEDLLTPFTWKDKVLLDPFMGSGTIGRMVIEKCGSFIGYDIDLKTLKKYKWM